jgi:hypothetical protein
MKGHSREQVKPPVFLDEEMEEITHETPGSIHISNG